MDTVQTPRPIVAVRLRRFLMLPALASAALLLAPAGSLSPFGPSEAWSQDQGPRGGGRGSEPGGRRGGMRGGGRMMGGGMRDVRELLEPDFVRRDVPLFVQQLELDDAQSIIVTTLMDDYDADYAAASGRVNEQLAQMGREMFQSMVTPEMRTRFEEEARSIREEIEQMREQAGGELDPEQIRGVWRDRMGRLQQQMMEEQGENGVGARISAMMGEMFDRLQAWQAEKARMRSSFVDGLQAQLRDDQLSLWPAFERFLVREKSLPRARLSGEDLNLFVAVDEAELSDESLAKLEPILDEYELNLDDALRRRDQAVVQGSAAMYQAIQRGDITGAVRAMERQVQMRANLRDLHDRYRAQLVAALGETDESRGLDRRILEMGFERIFRPTPTDRLFETVLELPDLSPEQIEAVLELQNAFLLEMSNTNQQLLAVTRRHEPQQQVEEAERFVSVLSSLMAGAFNPAGFGMGMEAENPIQEVMQRRGESGRAYRQRIESLLTPEQLAQLPEQRERGAGGGWGQMGEEMRAEAMRRFDRDGNGELSGEERREMMRVLREEMGGAMGEGRGQRGGGGGDGGRGRRGGSASD